MELLGSRMERRGQEGWKATMLCGPEGHGRGVRRCVECGMAGVIRIRAGGCLCWQGLGSIPSPILRTWPPSWEEVVARTARKMMSNGHPRPGLSS